MLKERHILPQKLACKGQIFFKEGVDAAVKTITEVCLQVP